MRLWCPSKRGGWIEEGRVCYDGELRLGMMSGDATQRLFFPWLLYYAMLGTLGGWA